MGRRAIDRPLLLAERATAYRALSKVPTMTNLSDLTLLIVDPSEQTGCSLRKSFADAGGANTHVANNFAVAEKLVETKKIDAALVHFSTDADTVAILQITFGKEHPMYLHI